MPVFETFRLAANTLLGGNRKLMKKLLLWVLCLAAVLTALASCQTADPENEDPGVTIPIYLTADACNFDPAYANLDDSALKIMGLLYEGLFKIDDNGKVVKAQAKSVKVLDDEDEDYYAIEITLKNTCWSDEVRVQAADYIYAWKRILESDFRGEAASMLLGIKNARAVNAGDMSIDDLGVTDVSIDTLRIEFEGPTDYDKFYEYLASPMLVPLREVAVDRVEKDWSSNSSVMVSNGPFMIRSFVYGKKMILERNEFYFRDAEKDSLKKSVTPYRLYIEFVDDASEALAAYEAGQIAYLGELPLDKRAEYVGHEDLMVSDTLTMMTCLFNTENELFSDPNVRKALSLAVDRTAIVELLTFATPAEGLIADGVYENGYGKNADTFREVGGSLISSTADPEGAKALLRQAGVTGGAFTLTVRDSEADIAVGKYLKSVWEELGFTVTVRQRIQYKYTNEDEYTLVADFLLEDYEAGNFDVILTDYTMLTTDAFPNLAMFAKPFAGGRMNMDVTDEEYELAPHISGYQNDEYDAKIEAAFAAEDEDVRAQLLHEAEAMLLEDMPIMPLVQLQSYCLVNDDLSKLDDSYWGFFEFTKVKLANSENYVVED